MKTIAICNLKGGVAKTTTVVNLAAILAADLHRNVLVIDADSQGNATSFLGGDREQPGMAALLRREPALVQETNVEGVRLIAASAELMDLDLTKAGEGTVDVQCLREVLAFLEASASRGPHPASWRPPSPCEGKALDYCLIDCPPAFNAASSAALIAADAVLIPVKLDAFALEGMANLLQQIQNMRRINPQLQVLGVLPVMWYKSERIQAAERALREVGLQILPRIRRSDKVDEMTYRQAPLISCSPKSGPCKDYRVLARWLDLGRGREEAQGDGE